MATIDNESEYQMAMDNLSETIEHLTFGIRWPSHISSKRAGDIMVQLKEIENELSFH